MLSLVNFPAEFPGLDPDAQVLGFCRPSFMQPAIRPDYVLAANLVRDANPATPMLFSVPFGRLPERIAEGEKAVATFRLIVAAAYQ